MELKDLLGAIRQYRRLAAVTLLVVLGMGLAAAYLPAERYRTSIHILVQPNPDKAELGAVQLVVFLMPSLAAKAESRTFGSQATAAVTGDRGPAPDVNISAEGDPQTAILSITGESTDPRAAAQVVNAAGRLLIANPPARDFVTLAVIDEATVPTSPASPARVPILLASAVLGAIVALFAALAANSLRPRLHAAHEIRRLFGTTVLGEVPQWGRSQRSMATPLHLFSGEGLPHVVEAFQQLRTNLQILLADRGTRSVAVTSVGVGEGKSTIAAGLAGAMASSGIPVTLIDADLRRSTLHLRLRQPLSPGLGNALAEPVESLLHRTELPLLTFVPAGTFERHPAEVVTTALSQVLRALEDTTQLAVVDSPPIQGAAESTFICSTAGAVLLVADARKSHLAEIERVLEDMRVKGADVLGIVINHSRQSWRRRKAAFYYQVPRHVGRPAREPDEEIAASVSGQESDHTAVKARPTRRLVADKAGHGVRDGAAAGEGGQSGGSWRSRRRTEGASSERAAVGDERRAGAVGSAHGDRKHKERPPAAEATLAEDLDEPQPVFVATPEEQRPPGSPSEDLDEPQPVFIAAPEEQRPPAAEAALAEDLDEPQPVFIAAPEEQRPPDSPTEDLDEPQPSRMGPTEPASEAGKALRPLAERLALAPSPPVIPAEGPGRPEVPAEAHSPASAPEEWEFPLIPPPVEPLVPSSPGSRVSLPETMIPQASRAAEPPLPTSLEDGHAEGDELETVFPAPAVGSPVDGVVAGAETDPGTGERYLAGQERLGGGRQESEERVQPKRPSDGEPPAHD